jgi:hypothetical protein
MEQSEFNFAATEVLESKPLSASERRDAVIDELRYHAEDGIAESEIKDTEAVKELIDEMKSVVRKNGRLFLKWATVFALLLATGCSLPRPRSVEVKTQYFNVNFELEQGK